MNEDPEYLQAINNLALLYKEMGNIESAEDLLKKLVMLS